MSSNERVAVLRGVVRTKFQKLNQEFSPNDSDLAVFQIMGVRPCKDTVEDLMQEDRHTKFTWKEKSSTWKTKK